MGWILGAAALLIVIAAFRGTRNQRALRKDRRQEKRDRKAGINFGGFSRG